MASGKRGAAAAAAGRASAKRRRSGAENAANLPAASGPQKKLLDPRQNKAERQRLRLEYRKLSRETRENAEVQAVASTAFKEMLGRTNALFQSVLFPSEAVHDSSQLETLAKVGAAQAHRVTGARAVQPSELMAAAAKRFGRGGAGGALQWDEVGVRACKFARFAPACVFMNGPLAVPLKERKARQRRKVSELAEQVSPDLIVDPSAEEKTQTDQRVEALHRVLRAQKEPVPYLRFVVNPESFTQSAENMFDLSFLIKHAKASIFLSPHGVPMVEARNMLEPEELALEENRVKAIVLTLTYRRFLDAIAAFGITKTIVPTRSIDQEATGAR